MVAIQIRSQVLRQRQGVGDSHVAGPFAVTLPDDEEAQGHDDGRAADGTWRERDVARAIAIAEEAGLTSYRVEIAPDGTISIVVSAPPEPTAEGDRAE